MNAPAPIPRQIATRPPGRRPRGNRRCGFVLLEVLISLVILGITVSTILRSFTLSLDAAVRTEIFNTATLLAQSMIDEIQISPPGNGDYEGDFGEAYEHYSYRLTLEDEEIDYKSVRRAREIKEFRPLRRIHLEVLYADDRRGPFKAITLDSALMGLQKFTNKALAAYQLFDLY
jgi:prepilin-type N-terminal cleavage/methylation domain-containing protein